MYSKEKYESVTKQILLKVQSNHTVNIFVPQLKMYKELTFWAKVIQGSDSHFCFESCVNKVSRLAFIEP